MEKEEFKQKHSPFFGDVIFSREPTGTSRFIQNLQKAKDKAFSTSSDGTYFSHVAFVIDCNLIIHATMDGDVDLVSFEDFFIPEMEYKVYRNTGSDGEERSNATYYLGQEYDSISEFVKRFLFEDYNEDKQVCSTLVANMLNNYSLYSVSTKDTTSPTDLYRALRADGWLDKSDLYVEYLKLSRRGSVINKEQFNVLRDSLNNIKRNKENLIAAEDILLNMRKLDLLIARSIGDSKLIKAVQARNESYEPLDKGELSFHSTDSKQKKLFK